MSRVLLDSHAFVWFIEDDSALSPAARRLIEMSPDVCVSIASAWELAIKVGRGKLTFKRPLEEMFRIAKDGSGINVLPVDLAHALEIQRLPRLEHADPFDRLIVVQALALDATLVSADKQLDGYGVRRVW